MLSELLNTPARQAAVLDVVDHRPWALPEDGWVLAQTLEDQLFAHWPVSEEELRPLVPEQLELDTRDGSAWLGVTPFRVTGLRLRGTLPLPYVSELLELNVRTYVTFEGRPGIWFASLDASSALAVEVARLGFGLPYARARMSCVRRGDRVEFRSSRAAESGLPFVWESRHEPDGDAAQPAAGTLEHFLTERYRLYTVRRGRVHATEIHHPPWRLRPAAAEIELNTMAPRGVALEGEPVLHLSERQDVLIWPPAPTG